MVLDTPPASVPAMASAMARCMTRPPPTSPCVFCISIRSSPSIFVLELSRDCLLHSPLLLWSPERLLASHVLHGPWGLVTPHTPDIYVVVEEDCNATGVRESTLWPDTRSSRAASRAYDGTVTVRGRFAVHKNVLHGSIVVCIIFCTREVTNTTGADGHGHASTMAWRCMSHRSASLTFFSDFTAHLHVCLSCRWLLEKLT
jgi:hypothetical protein